MEVALVTWHSVKEMVFEGGPHPWVLEPSRFFLELSVEKSETIQIAQVRLPAKRKQNQYIYRVLCLDLGEQVGKCSFSNIVFSNSDTPNLVLLTIPFQILTDLLMD